MGKRVIVTVLSVFFQNEHLKRCCVLLIDVQNFKFFSNNWQKLNNNHNNSTLQRCYIFFSQWPIILYVIDCLTRDLVLMFQMYLVVLENYLLLFDLVLIHHWQYKIVEFSFSTGSKSKVKCVHTVINNLTNTINKMYLIYI